MPSATGINHIAFLSSDLDRTVAFYREVFDAAVVHEVQARDDHPRMQVIDIGGGAFLNVFEVPAEAIVGERNAIGRRGAIDHFGFAVASPVELDQVRRRLVAAGASDVSEARAVGLNELSVFFRDPDGMELEVCCPV